jgi:hypothetical protein
VEVLRHLGGIDDRDRVGQERVEAAPDPAQRNRPLGAKARDLTARVHAGIGARCAGDRGLVLEQPRERFLEVTLHARAVDLALPPAERGAVVFDDEPDVAHAAL